MRALAELDVLIVDCQTTGASPAFGQVLELGWAQIRAAHPDGAAAEAHWITLPEGYVVPRQVRKITGYEPTCASGAIAESEAWRRLLADVSTKPAPAAIHYARFELSFLRDWAARFEPEAPFPIDAVCVHAIARRLFPDLPRQSLRALAGYLGHGLDLTRRSLGHVEATAFVWTKLCDALGSRGVTSWEALKAWLAEPAAPIARPKKPKYPILRERYTSLPDAPGVYRLLRSNGDVLYVGKAASLKKRVTSHFQGRTSKQLAPEMLTQVSDVAFAATASALEAALLEHDTIEALRPPYNVQLVTSDPRVWYASAGFDSASSLPDPEHVFGPVPSEYSLRPLGALIALSAGAAVTRAIRAQAVGISDLWIPEEDVFEQGWSELVARHSELADQLSAPRTRALRLARRLLHAPAVEAEEGDDKPDGWDPERVARHVESAVVAAYRGYRRARWLGLLYDSDVVYREPKSATLRLLEVRAGRLAGARDAAAEQPNGAQPTHAGAEPHFDRLTYDRLRVLTTELKRVCRDGGVVSVRPSGRRRISEPRMRRILSGI